MHKKGLLILRWIARIWGSLLVIFVLIFLIADLFNNGDTGQALPAKDVLAFIFFPAGTVIGFILAWKWEGLGGLISLLSIACLLIIRPDLSTSFFLTGLVIIPALLFIIYWKASKKNK